MKVSEIFSPTIQGEGNSVGMISTFVRLSGCNLSCQFCDSKYANKGTDMGVDYVSKKVHSMGIENVIFTGGEPMLQREELSQVMGALQKLNSNYKFYLETNGTIYDNILKFFEGVSCSPKKQSQQYDYSKISKLKDVRFKFVYEDKNDKWWESFIDKYQIPRNKVWIMPEGKTKKEQMKKMKEVVSYCLEKKFNFSPRLHILIYSRRRGV